MLSPTYNKTLTLAFGEFVSILLAFEKLQYLQM